MGFTELLHKIPVSDLIQWGQKDYAEEFRPASAGGAGAAGDGAEGGAEGVPTWVSHRSKRRSQVNKTHQQDIYEE